MPTNFTVVPVKDNTAKGGNEDDDVDDNNVLKEEEEDPTGESRCLIQLLRWANATNGANLCKQIFHFQLSQ